MLNLKNKDFQIIKSWNLKKNPFRAIKDFSHTLSDNRHLNKDYDRLYKKYFNRRKKWTENKNFKKYYTQAAKPIDRQTWDYLRQRKAYFQMPINWEKISLSGGSIVDIGCGDGDLVQNLIYFIENYWKKHNIRNKKINIIGLDLNHSRIKNANNLVKSKNKNISFRFEQFDFLNTSKFKTNQFDYSIVAGVFEIIEEKPLLKLIKFIEKITKKGIYIEDVAEKFPGGFPRNHLGRYFKKFKVTEKYLIFSEPFNIKKIEDPKKIWPIFLDQNLWLEKKN
jgi:ubiquinone/menaquinone biosynthesis C-methylase UbiE